jgi:hypothetical protein
VLLLFMLLLLLLLLLLPSNQRPAHYRQLLLDHALRVVHLPAPHVTQLEEGIPPALKTK